MSQDLTSNIDEFNRISGEVLRQALHIESTLERFISDYFVRKEGSKSFFLRDVLLSDLNFEKKINLFKQICKREKFDENKVKEIVESIYFVKGIRNKVAHWDAETNIKQEVQLRKRKSFTTMKDVLKFDDSTIKRIDKERLSAITGINEFYMKYYKEGTIDERPEAFDKFTVF